jgi:hypothetical protein
LHLLSHREFALLAEFMLAFLFALVGRGGVSHRSHRWSVFRREALDRYHRRSPFMGEYGVSSALCPLRSGIAGKGSIGAGGATEQLDQARYVVSGRHRAFSLIPAEHQAQVERVPAGSMVLVR